MKKFSNIKKEYVCSFHRDCSRCPSKNICVAAGSLVSEPREYFLRIKGQRMKKNKEMIAGTKKHEAYQSGMESATQIPFHVLRADLLSGKQLTFKEFLLCSPYYGLRGVIDVFHCKYDPQNNTMNVWIEEIKSKYWKRYFLQLAAYSMMLSDLRFRHVSEVKKRKVRRITHQFYPNQSFRLNIVSTLQVVGAKPITIEWMRDNMATDWANGVSASVLKKAKALRALHKLGIYWLQELPWCRKCRLEKCGYYAKFCSKLPYHASTEKTKQQYFGKVPEKRLLIKTKPKLNLAELEGMVKIR